MHPIFGKKNGPLKDDQQIAEKKSSIIWRLVKIAGWAVGVLLLFFMIIFLLIQIPAVQQAAQRKTTAYLEEKWGSPVRMERLSITFPKLLVLQNLYLEDNKGDTLLFGGRFTINLSMFSLLKGNILVNELWMQDMKVVLDRDSIGAYNFDHIINAFTAKGSTLKADKGSSTLSISLEQLKLNRVNVRFQDAYNGLDGNFSINQLRANFKSLNFTDQEFTLNNLTWNGGDVAVKMWRVSRIAENLKGTSADSLSSPLPHFRFQEADVSEVKFSYQNKDEGMDMDAYIGTFLSEGLNLALDDELVDLGKSRLKRINYAYRTSPPKQMDDTLSTNAPNWRVLSRDIALIESRFQYDDLASPTINRGMDYSHMLFRRINLIGTDLYVSGGDTVMAKIEKGSLTEKGGFQLNNIETELLYTTKGVRLDKLLLITPYTRLQKSIEVGYESPSFVADNPGELWMDAVFSKARIGHRDLLNVAPLLYEYPMFADLPNAIMEVDGKVKGQLKDLTLTGVTIKAFGDTYIKASGRLTGLPDPNNITSFLNVQSFTTTDRDIRRIIPEGIIPDYVTLPASMSLKGKISGSVKDNLAMDLNIKSSMGDAGIKGFIRNADNADKAQYDLQGFLNSFEAGKLIGATELGKLTLEFAAKGKHYNPKTLTGIYALKIGLAEYEGIAYRNINVNLNADNGLLAGEAYSSESPHQFKLDFNADLRNEFAAVSGNLQLLALDLQYLGMSDKPFSVSADMDVDIPRLDPDYPQGYFFITNFKGLYDTTHFELDSITAIASKVPDGQYISLTTDFGKAEIRGNYSAAALFPELINFINTYYVVATPVPALRGDQQANIKVSIFPSPRLSQLLPGLEMKKNIEATLDVNTAICLFDLEGSIPALKYGDQVISGGSFFAESNDSAIAYKIFVDDYYSSIYEIPTLLLQGDIIEHKLYLDVRLLDNFGRLQHTLAAGIEQKDSGYAIHFDPESVLLNYDTWKLDPGNELFFSKDGVYANAFTFSNGTQALVMQTWGDNPNDPIGIRLFNFKISTFTGLARQDSLNIDGLINGFAEIQIRPEHPIFLADMELSNLTFRKDTIGNIKLKVSNEVQDVFHIDASMSGYDNDITIYGDFFSADNRMDIQFDVEKLTLSTLQPFTQGYLSNMMGHLEGGISITGTTGNPVVIGNLLFRDAVANVPLLNSVFSLRNERIRFLKDGMHFEDFTLTDQNGKTAVLNGAILTSTWLDYTFNMDFVANDFRVINSTRRDNKLFYGTLFLDTRISFRGNSDRPIVNASFRANERTDLTMVMPQANPEIAEREGVVDFFDASLPDGDSVFTANIDSLNTTTIRGLTLSANLEIDPRAKLSFIIDEVNGDMLVANGIANLSGSMDPSGKVTLTGTYELIEGSYDMSLRMVKFKFQIEKGSTITWTGEPTNADINITALYNVKTAPYDLVEQQIIGETDETKAKYRDRIPFRVKLKVRGELLKPDISFDIEIAETSGTSSEVVSTVNSKLDQLRIESSAMNQQVFALILFGTFVPDSPFGASSGSTNMSAFARQSVSKMLADQLNQLAGSLISGVDVDIGIESEEDYSTGTGQTRTDLNVAFSKRLLKDRLKVTVGSNFEMQGASRPDEKTSNIAGDIKAEYTLTRDGRYVLRAYRIDQYEVALQGQVVETGVTFIINLDFDAFREIFQKRKKDGEITR